MNISYLKISLNQSVFTCLSNCITTLPITLELFKPSKDSARLRDCNEKKIFGVMVHGCFCEWCHFGYVTWPSAQTLDVSILLTFSLETTLESESFEPLINFLTFLVQKLWSINLISQIILLVYISGAQSFWLVGHICLSETLRGPQELIISIKIL